MGLLRRLRGRQNERFRVQAFLVGTDFAYQPVIVNSRHEAKEQANALLDSFAPGAIRIETTAVDDGGDTA